jgi:omega-6 fatty acid desaturase (delta-12 desaturase)
MSSIPDRQGEAARVAEAFCQQNNLASVGIVFFDYVLYFTAVGTAIFAQSLIVKVSAVIVAGTATSMLFILGHDAAHRSLVTGRLLNAALGRVLFLPCLHNYTLWVIQHNRLHHQFTNVRGLNSYSPLSVAEFRQMALWRRFRERLYRSPFGFGLYYLVERWWRDKFFPRRGTPVKRKGRAWLDFALLCGWVTLVPTLLFVIGVAERQVLSAFLWGFVGPFMVWNQLMGLTAFLQHTNPLVPWFRTKDGARAARTQAEVTLLVEFPRWYDLLSHNIMHHQAHHVNARIPWFRLRAAQMALTPMLGPRAIAEKMGFRYLLKLTKTCQLYDYDSGRWMTYAGRQSVTPDGDLYWAT